MIINCSYQQMVPISQVIEHPQNPNKHSDRQIELLAKILNYQGWRHPLVVSSLSGHLVSGHARLRAAKLNGWTEVPCDIQKFDDKAQEIGFLIADNKIAELADHDDEAMKDLIKQLELNESFDLDLFGVDELNLLTVDEINRGDENSEWVGMPEFQPGEKDIRISLIFNTELERQNYAEKYNLEISNKHSGQWIVRI